MDDAARYRQLRSNMWHDGNETLVVIRVKDLMVGTQTYYGELLDEAVDQEIGGPDIADVIEQWLKTNPDDKEKLKIVYNIINQIEERR
jgi:hypothetical protein